MERLHINDHMIVRDEEFFNRNAGLGFFSTDIAARFALGPQELEAKAIWLPSETEELLRRVEQGKSVLIEGGLGSGKSALIYGIRSTYRAKGRPYFYVDGHFTTTARGRLEAGLLWAQKKGALIVWDSADYLLAGSRKKRKLSLDLHRARSTHVLEALIDTVDSGLQIVATTHTEKWMKKYADSNLVEGPWQKLRDKLAIHAVRGVFEKSEELVNFLTCSKNIPRKVAEYFALLPNNPRFHKFLDKLDPQKKQEILLSLRTYRIAKLLIFHSNGFVDRLVQEYERSLENSGAENGLFSIIANFVIIKNEETKKLESLQE